MKQSDNKTKEQQKNLCVPEAAEAGTDSALVSGLERLAFKMHDLANRLLGYLR